MIDAIVFKFQTGTQWVHLPEKYGNWCGVYNRLRTWALDGTWERVFIVLMAQDDADEDLTWAVSVDSTVVRAHQHAAAAQKKGPGRIGREALRMLLKRHGITFQGTKTWKESTDPDFDAKLDRIEQAIEHFPDRVLAFDEFGPLGIRPTAGSCWAKQGRPDRIPIPQPRRPAGCPPEQPARRATSSPTSVGKFTTQGTWRTTPGVACDGSDHPTGVRAVVVGTQLPRSNDPAER
ncbi:Transposase [Streptomyces sp. Ncost-T10-10d]|nr:Transposase [Streptomyces sp. Ncost-T10-10d]